jgi:hypothetical protein
MHCATCLLLLISMLPASPPAVAGPRTYQCEIKEQLYLADSGALQRFPDPYLIGKRFAIDRTTGNIVAPELSLWSFEDQRTTILARGNSDNAFVLLRVGPARGGGVHSTFVQVNEFHPGPVKPFLVQSGSESVSGLCQ